MLNNIICVKLFRLFALLTSVLCVAIGLLFDLLPAAAPGFGIMQISLAGLGAVGLIAVWTKKFFYMSISFVVIWIFLFIVVEHTFSVRKREQVKHMFVMNQADVCNVKIPVRMLPDYEVNDGKIVAVKYGNGRIEIKSHQIALVMIDCRQIAEGSQLPEYSENIITMLRECRKYGVTIIHSPNSPTIEKYPQYHDLKREIALFKEKSMVEKLISRIADLDRKESVRTWTAARFHSSVYDSVRGPVLDRLRLISSNTSQDILDQLKPEKDEYVLESLEELFYVLWRRDIKLLFYVGVASNVCMLYRPTGALNLAGSNYVAVMLGDCSMPAIGPGDDRQTVRKIIEDFWMSKVGYVASSKEIVWGDNE